MVLSAIRPRSKQYSHGYLQPQYTRCVRSWEVGYYRRFIKAFVKMAQPLFALTKKTHRFQWTGACQAAFELLKKRLTTAPIIAHPQDEGQLMLDTDASAYAIGAVLSPMQPNKERQLEVAPCNHANSAIVPAVERCWRLYIL